MSRVGDWSSEHPWGGHLPERRICEIADAPSMSARSARSAAEEAHLDACARCRRLLVGYRRAESILSGAWGDRPIQAGAESAAGDETVDRVRLRRVGVAGPARGQLARRWAVAVTAAAVVGGVAVGAGLVGLRSSGPAGQSAGASAPLYDSPGPPRSSSPTASFPVYVTQAGDTWSSIAAKFNLSLLELEFANPQIQDPNLAIKAGQLLYIPPSGLATPPSSTFMQYWVRPGDNFSKIASQFNLKLWELQLANPQVKDPNHIVVGEALNIPPAGLLTQPPA
jgi:LysM repeat protein